MSDFWSIWITVITLGNVLACFWLVWWASKPHQINVEEGDVTGHKWDGLEELNNPLPRWWLWLFYATIIFTMIYFVLYPGLGNFKGVFNWSQQGQHAAEMAAAEEKYGPIFEQYSGQDIPTLAANTEAVEVGKRLYLNHCAVCHGSDAGGAPGFPSLADNDWLWGSSPEQIKASIANGRNAVMPAHGPILGDEGVKDVTEYVASLSGRDHDAAMAEKGKEKFGQICVACHMPDATGNQALGAPNLTDSIWLYDSTTAGIEQSIRDGRNGIMPATFMA